MKAKAEIFFLFLLLITLSVHPQGKNEAFKRQALILMHDGRYGEAVDLLDKYISADPRLAEGYHQRGLCFEKMIQYQNSVLDLRRAIRLDPSNTEIRKDLNRVISVWHRQLYLKIEGHKRDLAIDPNKAFTYLEIGKSYRWLEEWRNAEYWYDEYLKRDDNASPDEIIRYTEIIAKTGSIIKGEKILKKFVDRYPSDWRLWSRYGYFTMWLGKNKIAEDAFNKSLGYKPFFQEALDGLDEAKHQAYVTQYQGRAFERVEYPIDRYYRILEKNQDDDSVRFSLTRELIDKNRYEEAYQQLQYLNSKYADEEHFKSLWKTVTDYRDSTFNRDIATYTGILKENPTDKEAAMKLSAAYGNLFYYDSAIEILSEYLKDLPEDKDNDVRFRYAQYLAYNYEWDKSLVQVNKLIGLDSTQLDYFLLRGQIGAWTVQNLDLAENDLLKVFNAQPGNLPAILSLVTVYLWKNNYPEARKYLDLAHSFAGHNPEVESAESNYQIHLSAYQESKLFEMKAEAGNLAMAGNCVEAFAKYEDYKSKRTALTKDELIEYADIASCSKHFDKAIESYDKILADGFDYKIALMRAKNYYYNQDTLKAVQELENLSRLKPEDDDALSFLADSYILTNQPEKGEEIYKNLLSKAPDSTSRNDILRKMVYTGENYVKNKNFNSAEKLFSLIEKSSPDNQTSRDLSLRKIYLTNAMVQDKKLDDARDYINHYQNTLTDTALVRELNQTRVALADSYVTEERYGRAEDLYQDVIHTSGDTAQIRIVKQRIGWLPPSGFHKGINSIGTALSYFVPTNMGAAPFGFYYKDNQDFQLSNFGVRADAGFVGFLSFGVLWSRARIDISNFYDEFTQIKGIATLFFSKYISLTGTLGSLKPLGEPKRRIGDLSLKYERPEETLLQFSYENNDARMILYAPNLIYQRYSIDAFRFAGYYDYRDMARLSINYNFYKIGDGNEGNDFMLRIGKRFLEKGMFGYEYYYSDYAYISPSYYSPQNFESHSLWTEWRWLLEKNLRVKLGGKIGYVPAIDFTISEIYGEAAYNPVAQLIFTGRIGYGNSSRYDSSYRYFSASIMAYWGIY